MFEDSPWAAEYGEAANTQQLLEMGGSNLGTVVEDDQVRVELLDAVSTGRERHGCCSDYHFGYGFAAAYVW